MTNIMLALPRRSMEKNPENYAWAAVAVYLTEKSKLDYSTGKAVKIADPPSPPPDKPKKPA